MIPEYLLLGLAALMLFMLYQIYTKDAQHAKQMRSIASSVEELHREFYAMQKQVGKRMDDIAFAEPAMDKEEIGHEVEEEFQRLAGPVAESLQEVERGFAAFKMDVDKRLRQVEERMRSLSMPSSVSGMDDEKIIALFKQGVAIETIAKELRLSKPEVEFVLKINKIR